MPEHKMKVQKSVNVTMRDGVKSRSASTARTRPASFRRCLRVALPVRVRRGAGLSAVPVARDRTGRMVRRAGLRLRTRRRARLRPVRRRIQLHGLRRATGLCRADCLDHQAAWCNGRVGGIGQSYYAMAQWLMATSHPPGLACIVPYDGLVDQYRCSNYHGGIFCRYRSAGTIARADNMHRPAGARAGRRCGSIWSATSPSMLSTTNSGASARLLAAGQDQVPGAVDRPLGQDGAAPARQHPRLRGGQGAEEARRHRRAQHLRGAPHVRPDRIPREGAAAVLRPASEGHRQRLHGGRAGAVLRARRQRWRDEEEWPPKATLRSVLSAQGAVRQRHLAERRRAVDREARRERSRRRATPIRTGNGSTASPPSARTAGPIRCAAC